MIRGTITFKCDKCGNSFKGLDMEYMASALSVPQRCPKCGSMHTMPESLFGLFGKLNPQRAVYKKIWEEMDKD